MAEIMTKAANYSAGIGLLLLLASMFIEWMPIKLNPIGWLGERFNRKTLCEMQSVKKELAEHIAESWRSKILRFQNECVDRKKHTREEFVKIIKICDQYHKYIQINDLTNGEVEEAMAYIRRVYQKALDKNDFIDLSRAPLSSDE